jgi:hypothetical protein
MEPTFEIQKAEIIAEIEALSKKLESFTANVSPGNWRSAGSIFGQLKDVQETISNCREITPKEKVIVAKYLKS